MADSTDPTTDDRELSALAMGRLTKAHKMFDRALADAEGAIGTIRTGELEPVRMTVQGFKASGWIARCDCPAGFGDAREEIPHPHQDQSDERRAGFDAAIALSLRETSIESRAGLAVELAWRVTVDRLLPLAEGIEGHLDDDDSASEEFRNRVGGARLIARQMLKILREPGAEGGEVTETQPGTWNQAATPRAVIRLVEQIEALDKRVSAIEHCPAVEADI